LQKFLTPTQG